MTMTTRNARISSLPILASLILLGCISAQVFAESRQKGNSKVSNADQTKQVLMQLERDIGKANMFVWRDGRWQIVAGHSSRLPKPKQ
jgi:hypothetical protein